MSNDIKLALELIDDSIYEDDGVDRVMLPTYYGDFLGRSLCFAIGALIGLVLAYFCIIWSIDHMMVEAPVVK